MRPRFLLFTLFVVLTLVRCGGGEGCSNGGCAPSRWTGTKLFGPGQTSSVAIDSSGNLIVTGTSNGTGCFLAKWNSVGARVWSKDLVCAAAYVPLPSVVINPYGGVALTGQTIKGVDGNSQLGTLDTFTILFDTNGTKTWTKQSGVRGKTTTGAGITADSSGNVYVAGSTTGNLDGNVLAGTTDIFVTKFSLAGSKVWTKQIGQSSTDAEAHGIALSPSGKFYLVATVQGPDSGAYFDSAYLVQLDSAGNTGWSDSLSSLAGQKPSITAPAGVTTDADGNVYMVGYTNQSLDGNTLAGQQDFFLVKYDGAGNKQWTKQLGVANAYTAASGVAVDSKGNIYVIGTTTGGLDGNTLTGGQDYFLTKYNSSGAKQWTKQDGVNALTANNVKASVFSNGIAVNPGDNIVAVGSTDAGLDGNAAIGGEDGFISLYSGDGARQ